MNIYTQTHTHTYTQFFFFFNIGRYASARLNKSLNNNNIIHKMAIQNEIRKAHKNPLMHNAPPMLLWP